MQTFEDREPNINWALSKANLQEGGRILDIGTGRGWMAASLAKRGCSVVTVEERAEFQEGAKEFVRSLGVDENIEFKIGRITDLPFDNESFDGVVSYNTLHHTADVEGAIERMIELCKRGGKILIVELTEAGIEMISKHRHGHTHEVVDPSPILNKKDMDFQVFSDELTNAYVCHKM